MTPPFAVGDLAIYLGIDHKCSSPDNIPKIIYTVQDVIHRESGFTCMLCGHENTGYFCAIPMPDGMHGYVHHTTLRKINPPKDEIDKLRKEPADEPTTVVRIERVGSLDEAMRKLKEWIDD